MAITVQELINVMQKAGLPMEDLTSMRSNKPYVSDAVRPYIEGAYQPAFEQLDADQKAKMEKIANVDRQLTQIFGAGGKYALRNPADTENIIAEAEGVPYKDLMRTFSQKEDLLKEMEGDISGAKTLYSELIAAKSGDELSQYLNASGGLDFGTLLDEYTGESGDSELNQMFNEWMNKDVQVSPMLNLEVPDKGVSSMEIKTGSNFKELIKKYFPPEEWERAYNVMMGESGGRPDAIGDNFPIKGQTIPSYGLFQIRSLPGRPDKSILLNPEENVRYAAQMWKEQGWKPWTAAKKLGYVR